MGRVYIDGSSAMESSGDSWVKGCETIKTKEQLMKLTKKELIDAFVIERDLTVELEQEVKELNAKLDQEVVDSFNNCQDRDDAYDKVRALKTIILDAVELI